MEHYRTALRLATQYASAFVLTGLVSVVTYSAVAASREVDDLEAEVARDLVSLGRVLATSINIEWAHDGEVRARQLVAEHERNEEINVRWIWLEAPSTDAAVARAGRGVATRLANGDSFTWLSQESGAERVLYAYVPLAGQQNRKAALELSRPLVGKTQMFWTELKEQLAFATLVVAFAIVLAMLSTRWVVSEPLAKVAEQARRIGRGDLTQKLQPKGSDEVRALIEEQNAMCEALQSARSRAEEEAHRRIEALEALRHADRLRTVGTLASGIAHELGTPLNVISMRAKMIASGEVPLEAAPESARVVASQADRVASIVRQLMDFARRRTPKRAPCNLNELVERTSSLLSSLGASNRVQITAKDLPPLQLDVDCAQLEQALINLIVNAIQAMPNGGSVELKLREQSLEHPNGSGGAKPCAVIEVRDTGTGIAKADLDHIFEPFFTTKGVGEGTGLGLSVTHGIVEDHGGWMEATSVLGAGSSFSIILPMCSADHPGEQSNTASSIAPRAS